VKNDSRIWELDFLRGFCIFMMLLHHVSFDLRHVMGLDVFSFLDSSFFIDMIRGSFVLLFLLISGICVNFSGSYGKRSLKMAGGAILFSLLMAGISYLIQKDLYVFFNILHLLSFGYFFVFFLSWLSGKFFSKGEEKGKRFFSASCIFLALLFFVGEVLIPTLSLKPSLLLLPLGIVSDSILPMWDYLPIFPWLSFFFFGILLGQRLYVDRKSRFASFSLASSLPIRFFLEIGKHSLPIYFLHQPFFLLVLFLLRELRFF